MPQINLMRYLNATTLFNNITAITRGVQRFRVKKFVANEPYFLAEITKQKDAQPKDKEEFSALMDNIKDLAEKIINIDPNI
ncbi:MAG: hypothetical protein EOP54_25480, partial [Sphingobacteriales bacterium]